MNQYIMKKVLNQYRILSTFIVGGMMAFVQPCYAADVASEHAAIVAVVGLYIEGGRKGDVSIMKPAFHPEATVYSIEAGKIGGGPIQLMFDAIDKIGPAPGLKAQITSINLTDTSATARLELYDWAGGRYTDQLSLLKGRGGWQIIAKVYHRAE